ncbi:hypothetical protein [Neobacillus mesonae]|nr:hypothetical protein [Neobacillus mesonae]
MGAEKSSAYFIGAAFLIAHGVSGMITKVLLLAGIITMEFPGVVEVDVH